MFPTSSDRKACAPPRSRSKTPWRPAASRVSRDAFPSVLTTRIFYLLGWPLPFLPFVESKCSVLRVGLTSVPFDAPDEADLNAVKACVKALENTRSKNLAHDLKEALATFDSTGVCPTRIMIRIHANNACTTRNPTTMVMPSANKRIACPRLSLFTCINNDIQVIKIEIIHKKSVTAISSSLPPLTASAITSSPPRP